MTYLSNLEFSMNIVKKLQGFLTLQYNRNQKQ